jgi:glycosyltransferase involved in cell wall biosynthesis
MTAPERDMRMLSVIVPIYNEAERLEEILTERLFPATCPIAREWILVDDGSTDGSSAILDSAAGLTDEPVRVLHKPNGGKGTAVRAGRGRRVRPERHSTTARPTARR